MGNASSRRIMKNYPSKYELVKNPLISIPPFQKQKNIYTNENAKISFVWHLLNIKQWAETWSRKNRMVAKCIKYCFNCF